MHSTPNRRGVLAMASPMAAFAVNDKLVAFTSQLPPAARLTFVRNVFSSALLRPGRLRVQPARRG